MGPTADPGADVVMARLLHQFCTVLHAALGFVDLLAAEPLTAAQQKDAASVRAALDHLASMADEVLMALGRV